MSRNKHHNIDSDGFPVQQMAVLALCRICEPIAFMSIFPYVYYMVQQFKVAKDEASVATYAGMVTSAFAIAEFSTSILWGRISDRIGRKPVLIMGLFGTGLSMLLFGFAPNYWTALVARALGGLLNGNIGVINTTVAEVIKKDEHQARAFSLMPGIWCIGSILGSALGGTLADPVRNYPGTFAAGGLLSRFPYLLPNLICAVVVLFSMTVGFLFLEETHEEKKHKRDRGREIGDWLLGRRSANWIEKESLQLGRYQPLPDADAHQPSRPSVSSPRLSASGTVAVPSGPEDLEPLTRDVLESRAPPASLRGAFTFQVKLVILSYGILALHTIAADQLLPVMLSLPRSNEPVRLPFLFTDGFELSTKAIGAILSVQGVLQTFAILVLFPLVSNRIGSLMTFRLSMASFPFLYIIVPYTTLLPEQIRMPILYILIFWKVVASAFAYPPINIILTNAAPSKTVLGTLNGTAASSASLSRAIGPTVSGAIQAAGLMWKCLGLPWWVNGVVAVFAAAISFLVHDEKGRAERSNVESCATRGISGAGVEDATEVFE